MRLLLVLILTACGMDPKTLLEKEEGSENQSPEANTEETTDETAETDKSKDFEKIVLEGGTSMLLLWDAEGNLIGAPESQAVDLEKDFYVTLKSGLKVKVNNSSRYFLETPESNVVVYFPATKCHKGSDGWVKAFTRKKYTEPVLLNIRGDTGTSIVERYLFVSTDVYVDSLRVFSSLGNAGIPTSVKCNAVSSSNEMKEHGYRLEEWEPPFPYPMKLPFELRPSS